EVVPAILGRLDAVTDEHDFGALDGSLFGLHTARRDVLVPPREGQCFSVALEGPGRRHGALHTDELDLLLPGRAAARRYAERRELAGEVRARRAVPARGRAASFEFVRRDLGDV